VEQEGNRLASVTGPVILDSADNDWRAMVATHGVQRNERLGWQGKDVSVTPSDAARIFLGSG
jgi:hypothetical protein